MYHLSVCSSCLRQSAHRLAAACSRRAVHVKAEFSDITGGSVDFCFDERKPASEACQKAEHLLRERFPGNPVFQSAVDRLTRSPLTGAYFASNSQPLLQFHQCSPMRNNEDFKVIVQDALRAEVNKVLKQELQSLEQAIQELKDGAAKRAQDKADAKHMHSIWAVVGPELLDRLEDCDVELLARTHGFGLLTAQAVMKILGRAISFGFVIDMYKHFAAGSTKRALLHHALSTACCADRADGKLPADWWLDLCMITEQSVDGDCGMVRRRHGAVPAAPISLMKRFPIIPDMSDGDRRFATVMRRTCYLALLIEMGKKFADQAWDTAAANDATAAAAADTAAADKPSAGAAIDSATSVPPAAVSERASVHKEDSSGTG